MSVLRLDRVGLNVADLHASAAFYVDALGFTQDGDAAEADPALAALLGARRLRTLALRRGAQRLELAQVEPAGAPYPADSRSNDLWFQHCALTTSDMPAALARLQPHRFTPISRHGPQPLPGGIVAYKFRDADGHPLELIEFPKAHPRTARGIDHSAISVADAGHSIAFYAGRLGLSVRARQVNTGPAQDALDALDGTRVDVVALDPAQPAPHLELLAYHAPRGRALRTPRPADIVASRLVFAVDALPEVPHTAYLADGSRAALLHDPDGHAVLLEQQAHA